MSFDADEFGLSYHSEDGSTVLADYIQYLANGQLIKYKRMVHTGGKAGESLWTHIMNLVTTIEKLRPLFKLTEDEMRVLLLALTIHDLNKLSEYSRPEGASRDLNYANAVTIENIETELKEKLKVGAFFPKWEDYLADIKYLADGHQEKALAISQVDARRLQDCRLDEDRLVGPLKFLMKVADVTDNSHSGDQTSRNEKHIRDKLINHVNAALNESGIPFRYRFIGHRIAEQRGILTNVIHNQLVAYLRERFGKAACIDLLYHPEGVDYLLDKRVALSWTAEMQQEAAKRVRLRFAELQLKDLEKFIKATPSGIHVDDAAIQSNAPLDTIFQIISNTVENKRYTLDWREQRNAFARNDLEKALATHKLPPEQDEQVSSLLQQVDLVPSTDEALKQGEFASAYRNFLKDHRSEQLKALKEDAWTRVYRLFKLPVESYALYALIDPFRRGYFLARDLPGDDVYEMKDAALQDLADLEEQAARAFSERKQKSPTRQDGEHVRTEPSTSDSSEILDYLERHLEIWDSVARDSAETRPVQTIDFGATLRRYADPKRLNAQCCHSGSPLKADEWMSIQVPSNIGVQSFSNRLDGGSARDPKRNVCAICRTQFILEKLAWRSHKDKQGNEEVTFYLHLFPYSYFTQPMLLAWWESIQRVKERDHTPLFSEDQGFFARYEKFQGLLDSNAYRSDLKPDDLSDVPTSGEALGGLSSPAFAEAMSNTPVLPFIVGGNGYGRQFLVALEKSLIAARWFDCRVILSRMPVPLLNLNCLVRSEDPIALLIENPPHSLSWLLPETSTTRSQLDVLSRKLGKVHAIAQLLATKDADREEIVYDLLASAAADPLALYYEVDRLIEQNAARARGRRPEYQAIDLSARVAPLLAALQPKEGEPV